VRGGREMGSKLPTVLVRIARTKRTRAVRLVVAMILALGALGWAPVIWASSDPKHGDVAELRADLVNLSTDGSDDGADLLVTLATWQIAAPADKLWNKNHPQWPAAERRVRRDLGPEIQNVVAFKLADAKALWDGALAEKLTETDIDDLLRFLRSAQGKRYTAFQRRLDTICAPTISRIASSIFSGHDINYPSGSPPPTGIIDARVDLLAMSLSSRMLSQTRADNEKPGVQSGLSMEPMIWSETVLTRGSDLDSLRVQYGSDLKAFAAFTASQAMRKVLLASAELRNRVATDQASKRSAALTTAVTQHLPMWRAEFSDSIKKGDEAAEAAEKLQPEPRSDLTEWANARKMADQAIVALGESANERRIYSVTVQFELEGVERSVTSTWWCRKSEASNSATPGWTTSSHNVVKQMSNKTAIFFSQPAECDIEDGAIYQAWLGVFPDIADVSAFDFYPAPEKGNSLPGAINLAVVHQLTETPPPEIPSALEARVTTIVDHHIYDYKTLVGKVEIEPEWRSRLAAATCGRLEQTSTIATSMELFQSAYFPINRDVLATQSGRSVRILNSTFAGGTWVVSQEAPPQNFMRFTTTHALPAIMDSNPRAPISIDYEGKTASLDNILEFFDPQNKTIIRVEIDYPLLGSMQR